MRRILSITVLLLAAAVAARAQDVPVAAPSAAQQKSKPARPAAPKLPPDPNKFAIILGGVSGEEEYAQRFSTWIAALRGALVDRLGFAPANVAVFTEKPSGTEKLANAENVRAAFVALRNALKAENQLFLFFIGHGSFDATNKVAKFNLVGPDLSAGDYGEYLGALPTKQIIIVNMASASGEFIKTLSAEGRIVVTATRSGMEQNATHFAQYFIEALGNPEADADKNGRVSVFEAFDYATRLTAKFYESKGNLVLEHALLDDNGDGAGHPKGEEGDGGLAKTTYFDSLPLQLAGGSPELAKLFSERLRLEGEIEGLKARKAQLKEDAYEDSLEKLLIDLAKLNRTIKTKQK